MKLSRFLLLFACPWLAEGIQCRDLLLVFDKAVQGEYNYHYI